LAENLQDYGVELIAPHRSNRKPENKTQDGRPLRRYARRWTVERTIAWFQNYRRHCIRWEKSTKLFQGYLRIGCVYYYSYRFWDSLWLLWISRQRGDFEFAIVDEAASLTSDSLSTLDLLELYFTVEMTGQFFSYSRAFDSILWRHKEDEEAIVLYLNLEFLNPRSQ
jgi:hypothetical protein